MRIRTLGLAALMGGSLTGDGVAQSLQNEIQNEEAPGSEIPMNIGGGRVEIGRVWNMTRSPVEIGGQMLAAPDDPDKPYAEACPARDPRISPALTTTTPCPTDLC